MIISSAAVNRSDSTSFFISSRNDLEATILRVPSIFEGFSSMGTAMLLIPMLISSSSKE